MRFPIVNTSIRLAVLLLVALAVLVSPGAALAQANDDPVAVDDSVTTNEGTAVDIDVIANDTDVDGDALSVTAVSNEVNGSATIKSGSTTEVTFTPTASFTGTASFDYTVSDGTSSDAGTVTVTVNAIPVATDDSLTIAEDAAATDLDVIANDTDADTGDTLSINVVNGVAVISNPSNGTAALKTGSTTEITYTPNANFNGSDSFTYGVSDGNGGTATGTVNVTITAVNDDPVATNDSLTIAEDAAATDLDVIANDTDVDTGDTLSINVVNGAAVISNPSNGTAALKTGSTTEITYTPNANFNGTDSFTYEVSDGNGGTATGTVNVTITAVNDDPVAVDDSVTTNEGTAVDIDVIANDTDVDGDALSVTAVSNEVNGIATIKSGSTTEVTFTPTASFTGTASFDYTVSDGTSSDAGTVTVTVNAIPVATDDSLTIAEDAAATDLDVIANDTDADTGDTLSINVVNGAAVISNPSNGTAALKTGSTTEITYTPNANFNGTDSFTYEVSDGKGGTATGTVNVTITAVNDDPVAVDDSVTTNEGTAVDIDVIANDTDVDGDALSVTAVSNEVNGSATIKSGSTTEVTFTPTASFTGTASFDYTVSDGTSSDAGTVTVTVNAIPVATDDSLTIAEDAAATDLDVIANDTDADTGDTLSINVVNGVAVISNPSNGTAALKTGSTTEITYTPNANFNGSDSFTYGVSDGNGGTATGTVNVTITAVNDDPVATNDSLTIAEDAAATDLDVIANDTDVDTGDTLSINVVNGAAVISNPSNGTAALKTGSTTEITYTPNANFNGTDSFTYEVSDGKGGTATGTVNVTITAVNDDPVAVDDSVTTNEGTAVDIDVIANDTDVDGDALSVTAVSNEVNGSATIKSGSTTEVTFTPTASFTGTASFDYTVSDGTSSDAGTVTVTVNAIPVATDDSLTIAEDAAATDLDVIANDTDADTGDTLSINVVNGAAVISNPSNGTAALKTGSTTEITYTPNANFNGTDSFTYEVSDGKGGTATGTVNVTIIAVNDDPVAVDDSVTTNEGTAVDIDVIANDTDVDGDALSVTAVSNEVNGIATIKSGSTTEVTFTPTASFTGTASFDYTVSDGTSSDAGTVTVTVNAIPVATDDSLTIAEDAAATDLDVIANDTDADTGDTLSINVVNGVAVISNPSNGTAALKTGSTTEITYTPNANFNGSDSFTYGVSDGNGGTATGTVNVTITAVNDDPVATNDSLTIAEDAAATDLDVIANDTDVDTGDTLSINVVNGAAVISNPSNGTAALKTGSTTEITYTPNANFNGTDSFTYEVSDGKGGTATGTVNVTITAVNDDPVAVDDSVTTNEGTAVDIDVIANDTDVDGDALSVTAVSNEVNGSATIKSGSTTEVTFTPTASFTGTASFDYTVSDGTSSDAGTVTVTVNAIPVATDDSLTIAEDAAATDLDVIANDTDADTGDTLSINVVNGVAVISNPSNGTAALKTGSTTEITYTPNANFNGSDSFTYEVSDGNGGTATGTVNVTITAVNDDPVATNDSLTIAEDAAATDLDVIANDTDADTGDTLSINVVNGVAVISNPSNGTAALKTGSTTEITYTPNANFNGTDSFTYEVSDGNGGTATGTVNVTITAVNDDPVAVDDSVTTNEGTAVDIDVIANDTDVDGDALSVTAVSNEVNGIATIKSGSTTEVTFTPTASFTGTASFDYTVSDGTSSDAGTVTVTVNAIPVATDDSLTIAEDAAATDLDVIANDTDADTGDTLSINVVNGVAVISNPSNGTAALKTGSTTEITYTPNANFNGSDSFTYEVSDGNGGTATGTVNVTITAVNDDPVAVDDSVTTNEGTAVDIDVIANDTDVDGDALSVTAVSNEVNGSATIKSGSTTEVTFTPTASFTGTASFDYTVSDGTSSDAGTVTVTVNAIPVATDDSLTIAEDAAATDLDVIANDTDADTGDTLSINVVNGVAVISNPSNGTAALKTGSTTEITYTPNANFNGSDSFTYGVSDGNGGTATGTVNVTITAVNDDPVATNDSLTIAEDAAATDLDVIANDTDADTGDTLSINVVNGVAVISNPSNGTAALKTGSTTEITYTPNANFNGSDSFTYEVSDGNGGTATGTVNVTITAVNDDPVAVDDSVTTNEGTAVDIDVIANDTDVDGDALSVTAVSNEVNGIATIKSGSTTEVTFTPTASFTGTASFDYTVSDGTSSDAGTVTVTVNAIPVATDDSLTIAEDAAATDLDVIANDTDADTGDTLSINVVNGAAVISNPSNGTAALKTGSTTEITYTPNANFNGTDSFTYEVSDGNGGTATGTVNVAITAVNDDPVAVDDSLTIDKNAAATDLDVIANDTDVDTGDTLSINVVNGAAVISNPSNGTAALKTGSTTEITYTPNANYHGSDSFTYEVNDGNGGTAIGTVNVTIRGVADLEVRVQHRPAGVYAGEGAEYFFVVRNAGPDEAPDTTLTVTLPAGVTLEWIWWECEEASDGSGTTTYTCYSGTIDQNDEHELRFRVHVSKDTTDPLDITAVASSIANDTDSSDDSATATTRVLGEGEQGVDLRARPLIGPKKAATGDTMTYRARVRNDGPSEATGVTLTVELPSEVTYQSTTTVQGQGTCTGPSTGSTTVTCDLDSIGRWEQVTTDIEVTIDSATATGSSLTATASVTSDVEELDTANDSASVTTEIVDAADLEADLRTWVDVRRDAYAGADFTYWLRVRNAGPSDAAGVSLEHTLPTGVTLSSTSPSQGTCDATATPISCELGRLPAGFAAQVEVTVSIDAATTGSLEISHSVSTTTTDPATDNDSATRTVQVLPLPNADLEVRVQHRPAGVYAGEGAEYFFVVRNAGPDEAPDTTLTVTLPAGVVLERWDGPCAETSDGSGTTTLTCDFGTMGVDEEHWLFNFARFDSATGSVDITAVASDSVATDTDSSDNSATATTRVLGEGEQGVDLRAWPLIGPKKAATGDTMTYRARVRNDGPSEATGVTLTVELPSEVTYQSTTTVQGQGTCTGPSTGSTTVTCDLGSIGRWEQVTTDIEVTIDSATTTGSSLTATASVTSEVEELDTANDSASVTTEIVDAADLEADLRTWVDVRRDAYAGADFTYWLRVRNEGPSDAAGVSLEHTLPTGVTLSSTSPSQGTCDATATPISCELGRLPAGFVAYVEVTVSIDAATTGSLEISHSVSTTTTDPATDNDSVTRTVQVLPLPDADLEVRVQHRPAGVYAGEGAEYFFVVRNAGPDEAPDTTLTVTLPAGVTLDWIWWECEEASDGSGTTTYTCYSGTIDQNDEHELRFRVHVSKDTTDPLDITAVASSIANDTDSSDDSATATTRVLGEGEQGVDLRARPLIGPKKAATGDTMTYRARVRNDGPSEATGVTLTVELPSEVTYQSTTTVQGQGTCTGPSTGSTTVTCDLDSIGRWEQVTTDIEVTIDSATATGSSLTATASVTSDVEELDTANDSASVTTEIVDAADLEADLRTWVDVRRDAYAGADFTYWLRVRNAGPSDAAGVSLEHTLPTGVTLSSTSPSQGTCDETVTPISCEFGRLPAGFVAYVEVTVSIDAATTGSLEISHSVSTTTTDPATDNDSVTRTVQVLPLPDADLEVRVQHRPAGVYAGEGAEYFFVVRNAGPDEAPDTTLTVTLPAGVTLDWIWWECEETSDGSGTTTYTCYSGTIDQNDEHELRFRVHVSKDTTDPLDITAVASSIATDTDSSDNSATATTRVLGEGEQGVDLRARPLIGPKKAATGDTMTYRARVRNDGPSEATGVTLTVELPSEVTYQSTTTVQGQGTCTGPSTGSTTVTCDLDSIGRWEQVTTDIEVTIDSATATGSSLTATASVTSDVEELDTANDSASVTTEIVDAADLEADLRTWVDVRRDAYAGADFTYWLRVRNAGPSDAAGVSLEHTLPTGVTLSSTSPSQGTCDETVTPISCEFGRLPAGFVAYVEVTVSIDAATTGSLEISHSVSTTTTDPATDNDSATRTVQVLPLPNADLEVRVQHRPAWVYAGEGAEYFFVVRNAGPDEAPDTTLTVTLPAGVTLDWIWWECEETSDGSGTTTYTCYSGTIDQNDEHELRFRVHVSKDTTDPLDITAVASSIATDTDSSDNSATATTRVLGEGEQGVDLRAWPLIGPKKAATGDTMTYRVWVRNDGPSEATGVTLTVELPSEVTYQSTTTVQGQGTCTGPSTGSTTVTCDLGSIGRWEQVPTDIEVTIDSATTTGSSLTATASVTSEVEELDTANDSATVTTEIVDASALEADLRTGVGVRRDAYAGADFTYGLWVRNAGPSDAAGVSLEHTLPTGVTLSSTRWR